MSLLKGLSPGGKNGVASHESRDPIGYAVAALSRVAGSHLVDRLGLRRSTERAVYTVTRDGFRVVTSASRTFARSGRRGVDGTRIPSTSGAGVFDLTPTDDQQMLVELVDDFAARVVRPAAAALK